MNYTSPGDIFAANEAAQERFAAAVAGLSETQGGFRPAEGRWTIAEIVEHVSIVNDGFLRITNKLLKQAEAAGRPARTELNLGPTSLLEDGKQNEIKFSAPDRVKPQGGVSIESALARMQAVLKGFDELRPRIEATDLTEETFPHPAFGEISAYRWIILLGEHEDRHRLQIEAIKQSPGYPA